MIKLIRRPKAASRMKYIVRQEVRAALNVLAGEVQTRLEKDVSTWRNKPVFKTKVAVSDNNWRLEAKTDRRTKMGKIYGWIDKGVGEYGGFEKLPDIKAKRKNGFLGFTVPHQPKSLPNPAVPGIPSTDTPHGVHVKSVRHPGIYPRNFTETMLSWLKSRQAGAFRSVIEAAVKRAFRKIKSV